MDQPGHDSRKATARLAGLKRYGLLMPLLLATLGTGCMPSAPASQSASDTPPAWLESVRRWVTRDRQTFGYTVWETQSSLQAVVIAIHGLSGAARDFRPLGETLASQGVTTYAYELRGQGYDPVVQRRGDIAHWRLWRNDLDDFTTLVRHKHPHVPVLYYGESLGALIALHAAAGPESGTLPAGLILASPVVELKRTLSWWQVGLLRIMTAVMPTYRLAFDSSNRPPPKLTRDVAYQAWLRQAPQFLTDFTLRLLRHIESLMRRSHEAAARLFMPVLVLYAGQDAFTTPQMVERFFAAIASREKHKHLFPESYHLLLHDADRADVLRVITDWLGHHWLAGR